MAKKEENANMVDRFAEFKELKNIDKTTMISVLEPRWLRRGGDIPCEGNH